MQYVYTRALPKKPAGSAVAPTSPNRSTKPIEGGESATAPAAKPTAPEAEPAKS